jgi:hypothetical protein
MATVINYYRNMFIVLATVVMLINYNHMLIVEATVAMGH